MADSAPCSNFACTASTTTMASSTTIPIAKTRAKRVSRLIEYPNKLRKKNVPIIETGTAMAGISVDLKSCRNINTTKKTNRNASPSVVNTFEMEASRNSLLSKFTIYFIPLGNSASISFIFL